LNYTYGKSLGIVGTGGSGATLGGVAASQNPFDLRANYGALAGDRRNLFNAAYSFNLGNIVHGNKFAAGAVNGWQILGTTQLQSGANLTGATSNFSGGYNNLNGAIIPGSISAANPDGIQISNQSIMGTNALQLNPYLTCNPTSNLGSHQWINGNCFNFTTQPGFAGPTMLPAIYGPAFFNSDLGLFKNFQIKESMKLQFRVEAQNFLNHPLWSMSQGNALNLNFVQQASGSLAQTNPNFGIAQYKTGQRIVQLVAKFYF
jgi:hypothetical protein